MKVFVGASMICAFIAVASCNLSRKDESKVFNDYLLKYNIDLNRWDNIGDLKRTFIKRYNNVEKHNKAFRAGIVSYELGINEFSMLPYEQLVKQITGYIPSDDETGRKALEDDGDDGRLRLPAPASFSWLDSDGVVREVQNQSQCGSCWAFAAIGAIEGQMALKGNRFEKLSEQEVIECARDQNTGSLFGCDGGFCDAVYQHGQSRNGIALQSNRPYLGHTNFVCNTATPRAVNSRTTGYYFTVRAGNEELIKQTLFEAGPLYATFHASEEFSSYQSGIYSDSPETCNPTTYNNHAVLLVGYGSENGVDFWLGKNSWGTEWGENGFFRMERGRNLCGVAKEANYPELA